MHMKQSWLGGGSDSTSNWSGLNLTSTRDATHGNTFLQIAGPFDMDELQRRFPTTYKESMNTVLQQEAMRYNALLAVVAASLKECTKAVKGLVVMSPSLEAVCNSMFDNQASTSCQWLIKLVLMQQTKSVFFCICHPIA